MGNTSTITMTFDGCGASVESLTWAQMVMWRAVERFGGAAERFNMPRWRLLPRPVPTARAVKALRFLIENRQTLRTHFVAGTDGPRQHVVGTGTHEIAVIEVHRYRARQTALRTADEMAARRLDLVRDWPVRFCLLVERHLVVGVVLVASHVALDGWATDRLLADVLDSMGGRRRPRPERYTPLAHVRTERAGVGRGTLQHLERCLRAAVPSIFASCTGSQAVPRFHVHTLRSAGIVPAARTIADRCRTTTAAVLLAAASAVLATACGERQVPVNIIASNRFTVRYRSLAAALAQDALAVVPVGDTNFDDTVRLAYRSATVACCHSRYPPAELDRLRDRVEAQSGQACRITAYFNDARTMHPDGRPVEPAPRRCRRTDARGVLLRLDGLHDNDMQFYVRITSAGTAYDMLLVTDSHLFSAVRSEQLLRGIEALLLAGATSPLPVTGIAALTAA
ncbi:hypothetical protein [Micromonospora sp. WMMD987]|uniref:hypothetical protein n=1 Tax=Micromonospora sp. WMMD987 TaxID=3016089 RepID=UPI00249C7225|nr:hypothetical protein [Micromonospora sp. WMMD987]WFE95311.1 hypothetical protein O7612_29160 [Micromonospora sp. WMMD987]